MRKKGFNIFLYLILSISAVVFIAPIVIVGYNSLKNKLYIMSDPFALPNTATFDGENYIRGIVKSDLVASFSR